MNDHKDVIDSLEGVVQVLNDGREGYHTAADDVDSTELKTLFQGYAQQRQQYSTELRREIVQLGGDADQGESLLSAVHRGWINIKSAFTSGGKEAILGECETGDKMALETYEKALQMTLPTSVSTLLRTQHAGIQSAYQKVVSLKQLTATM